MRKTYLPLIFLILGFGLIILALFRGEANIALLLIFPIIYGSSILMFLGIILIFISFLLFFFIPFRRVPKREKYERMGGIDEEKRETEYGGVIFIGPIPIVFGKDKDITQKMLYLALIIALILVVLYAYLMLT
jgi:uncharacterized protein (TIGR00304 family)